MHTIQLEIQDDTLADKIISILNVFKDEGVSIKDITQKDGMTKERFETDIREAFEELQSDQGIPTGKFVDIAV